MNVNKCTHAGGTFIFWVADWFALMNDKMGGDLERIKTVGQYLIQVWTAAGMDMTRVKFLWSSEEITKHAQPYWTQALDIARRFTISRMKKCCQIMGRMEDTLTAAQILYPIMQCTDIWFKYKLLEASTHVPEANTTPTEQGWVGMLDWSYRGGAHQA